MQMPLITSCDMEECYYNKDKQCHAPAINVGDMHPVCDTFMTGKAHGGDMKTTGHVGACKVKDCKYNASMCCTASHIVVGHHGDHADCKTYKS